MKEADTPQAGESETPPRPRILLVDDDECTRKLNQVVLTQAGYDVDAAQDGAVAWRALVAESYDLMITDNTMPKVSGVELLKTLRAAHMALPVIMATRALPTEEFIRYPWLKPEATLVSPYTVEELLKTVKEVLYAADCAGGQMPPSQQPTPPAGFGWKL